MVSRDIVANIAMGGDVSRRTPPPPIEIHTVCIGPPDIVAHLEGGVPIRRTLTNIHPLIAFVSRGLCIEDCGGSGVGLGGHSLILSTVCIGCGTRIKSLWVVLWIRRRTLIERSFLCWHGPEDIGVILDEWWLSLGGPRLTLFMYALGNRDLYGIWSECCVVIKRLLIAYLLRGYRSDSWTAHRDCIDDVQIRRATKNSDPLGVLTSRILYPI